jgi:ankyrin repeat protein
MSSNHLKSNGAKLCRLIIDEGAETMRKYFDSFHPPGTLTTVLNANRAKLGRLKGVITDKQMNLLFPPAGMPPTTSNKYDITLLFVLLRTIYGLTAPASTGSFNDNPPSTDKSPEADLVRIKYYRNVLAHRNNTEVSDVELNTYWSDISDALVRLGADMGDIAELKSKPLDEEQICIYIDKLNEWHEKDEKNEKILLEVLKQTEANRTIAKENARNTKYIMAGQHRTLLLLGIILVSIVCGLTILSFIHFRKERDHSCPHNLSHPQNFSYFQNFSNPDFVGREWVFRELENILNASDARGVQLVADPGWGKSEIMKRLIHSPSSSAVIHENIIGHHFCKFNEESTRDGERFVKNLVQLIAKKITEFREIINKDQLIKDELQSNCKKNPIECFQNAIVEPLQKLNVIGRNSSFILIDALDECLEKEERHKSIIVNILSSSDNVPELPTWVKLIVTSRNQPQATDKISNINGFSTLKTNVTHPCNLQDLRNYAKQTLQISYSEVPTMEEKLPLNRSIDLAVEFSKGNFLFLERIIKLWRKYPDQMNAEYIPKNLGDIYTVNFAARFKEAAFADFQPLLEVLLAGNSPPMLLELDKIINYHYKNYNTRSIVLKLSEYFKSDIDQGPLEFHHQFFAEWLINQTHGSNGIVIQISRGHQYIVDYLFHFYSERQTNLTFKELSELCMHILHGEKASGSNLKRLGSLNVSKVRDFMKRCILHYLAFERNAAELIAVFMKQFNSVDILDFTEWTPAMYAVNAGIYENVKLFIDNGANVNHMTRGHVRDESCYFIFFMIPDYFHGFVSTMTSTVIKLGDTKIAKLLVESGANIEKAEQCGWKPLHLAALMGQFEIVQLYINKGAQPDLVSLHHAAARNRTEIVRFLLNNGVRDKCLPCKPGNCSWCTMNINRFHHCFCETALHAAVSRDNLEMAKLILQFGNASVNCKHGYGRTPLMEAFYRKNTQIVELLIKAGADITSDCQRSVSWYYNCDFFIQFSKRIKRWPTFIYSCNEPCNGNRLSLEHEFWEMMTLLISKGKLNALSDSVQRSMTAVIYNQVQFINATYGNRINFIPSIATMLRYVAVCHSVETLKHLLNSDDLSKFTAVYEDGKTLLHFATLGSSKRKVYVTQSCASSACVCPNMTGSDNAEEKRLETVMLLTKVLVSNINKQDKYGRTALHYAAVHGWSRLVEYLVNAGADWSIEDQRGDTALKFALREKSHLDTITVLPCRVTSDQVFRVCQSTRFDELVNYLLQNATIKKCDTRAKNLLRGLLRHQLPLSLYALFKSGLDVNCAREHFIKECLIRPHVIESWLRVRQLGEVLEVLKIFQMNVEVACDVPFAQSELHLMAHLRTSPLWEVGNLFQPSVNGIPFPLQRFIASHPKGVEILNECYDKEGYLAIHRAVQGENIDAVSWFIEIGVDLSKETKSNLTALALAIVNIESPTVGREYIIPDEDVPEYIFYKLLETMQEKSHAVFQCNTEHLDLSPLHLAGSRGMAVVEKVYRKIPALALPSDCTNSHGIQPIYLAYLYNATVRHISWKEDKEAFHNLGLSLEGPSKYPEREAEYHLIYNQFYRTPQEDLRNMLNHDGLFECPGINELLPHKTEIKDYKRLKACVTRCWSSAFEASREFSSNFRYLKIRNNFSNPFTDNFLDIAHHMAELRFHLVKMFNFSSFRFISISTLEKELWRKVTKAHSCAHNCSCFEIMQLLQEKFTSEPRYNYRYIDKLVAERMGWTDTSWDGDVKYRWPFSFLLKKALRTDKAYKYLEILSPHFNRDSIRESLRRRPTD